MLYVAEDNNIYLLPDTKHNRSDKALLITYKGEPLTGRVLTTDTDPGYILGDDNSIYHVTYGRKEIVTKLLITIPSEEQIIDGICCCRLGVITLCILLNNGTLKFITVEARSQRLTTSSIIATNVRAITYTYPDQHIIGDLNYSIRYRCSFTASSYYYFITDDGSVNYCQVILRPAYMKSKIFTVDPPQIVIVDTGFPAFATAISLNKMGGIIVHDDHHQLWVYSNDKHCYNILGEIPVCEIPDNTNNGRCQQTRRWRELLKDLIPRSNSINHDVSWRCCKLPFNIPIVQTAWYYQGLALLLEDGTVEFVPYYTTSNELHGTLDQPKQIPFSLPVAELLGDGFTINIHGKLEKYSPYSNLLQPIPAPIAKVCPQNRFKKTKRAP